jgi:hypothetical protein
MSELLLELFDELSAGLTKVENKHTVGSDSDDTIPEFEVVAGMDYKEKVEGNDQKGGESSKIASLNDRFRQSDPSTPNSDIQGEWIFSEDIAKLGATVEANIGRKVREFSDFADDRPLHDKGNFKHSKHTIKWQIRVYEDDSMQSETTTPEDPDKSYRVMLVVISDEH